MAVDLLAGLRPKCTHDDHTTVALFSKHGCPNPHRKLSRVNDGQESLKTGQPSENGGSHVLETSHGEGVGLAEVEATRTAMQGAMDHPGLNALPMAELAGSGVASELAPEGKSGEGSQPGEPLRRIRNQGQHPLGGGNGDIRSIGPKLNQWLGAGTSRRLRGGG